MMPACTAKIMLESGTTNSKTSTLSITPQCPLSQQDTNRQMYRYSGHIGFDDANNDDNEV